MNKLTFSKENYVDVSTEDLGKLILRQQAASVLWGHLWCEMSRRSLDEGDFSAVQFIQEHGQDGIFEDKTYKQMEALWKERYVNE